MTPERERIDYLEEEVRQLRDLLFAEQDFAFSVTCRDVLGTAPIETSVLRALIRRRQITREALMTMLYTDRPDDPPHPKILDVLIHKLRKRLEPHGIAISTVWGKGYRIENDDLDRLSELLGIELDTRKPAHEELLQRQHRAQAPVRSGL